MPRGGVGQDLDRVVERGVGLGVALEVVLDQEAQREGEEIDKQRKVKYNHC